VERLAPAGTVARATANHSTVQRRLFFNPSATRPMRDWPNLLYPRQPGNASFGLQLPVAPDTPLAVTPQPGGTAYAPVGREASWSAVALYRFVSGQTTTRPTIFCVFQFVVLMPALFAGI